MVVFLHQFSLQITIWVRKANMTLSSNILALNIR